MIMNIRLPESLESDEIVELFKKYEQGDKKIRNRLIEGNLKLVNNELKKFYGLVKDASYIEVEDLFEIGCIGLIKAVDNFDYKRNVKFSTYAVKCINNEIFMYLKKLKVRRIGEIISLNEPIKNDSDDNENDLKIDLVIADDNVEETFIRNEICRITREAINILSDFEKKLIMMNYGIDCNPVTKQELSQQFSCSRSYISKKNIESEQKMKKYILRKYSKLY